MHNIKIFEKLQILWNFMEQQLLLKADFTESVTAIKLWIKLFLIIWHFIIWDDICSIFCLNELRARKLVC